MSNIELRPTYWASFSGGKDSFYMIYYILNNLDKYPLDGVVHFELEIDFPFIRDVVDFVEKELNRYGIPMLRIKPRRTWEELYEEKYKNGRKWLYPTRNVRWCNSKYKLDASRQLNQMMKAQGKKVIHYIGFCADEEKRFRFELEDRNPDVYQIYPLAEAGIEEKYVLEWAKKQPIYNDYYKYNRRCGCMCCPLASLKELAYTKKYYPNQYKYFMDKALETEKYRERELGHPFSVWTSNPKYNTEYKMRRVDAILAEEKQMNILDYMEAEE